MNETACNLWLERADYRCILTSGAVANGEAVLDTPSAREAAKRYQGLEIDLGRLLTSRGTHVHLVRPDLISFPIKQFQWSGPTVDVIRRSAWVDEDAGTLIANNWGLGKRWERDAARERRDTTGPHRDWKRHVYTEEELGQLWEAYDEIEIRGAEPRYYEDVAVGDKVGPYITMPYVGREIISYYMGTGAPFMMSNSNMYSYMKRHPGVNVPDPETQTPDVPERTHYDQGFARYAGFPDMFDVLQPRSAYGTTMITNWMGDGAFLRELPMLGRRPVAYGDVCWIHGEVTEKLQRGGESLVKIVMAYDTQKWRASWGHALVSLPSRERGEVVLPEPAADPETEPYDKENPTPDYAKEILYQPEPDLPDAAFIKDGV